MIAKVAMASSDAPDFTRRINQTQRNCGVLGPWRRLGAGLSKTACLTAMAFVFSRHSLAVADEAAGGAQRTGVAWCHTHTHTHTQESTPQCGADE